MIIALASPCIASALDEGFSCKVARHAQPGRVPGRSYPRLLTVSRRLGSKPGRPCSPIRESHIHFEIARCLTAGTEWAHPRKKSLVARRRCALTLHDRQRTHSVSLTGFRNGGKGLTPLSHRPIHA